MLIPVFADTHFGVRQDSKHFHNGNRRFFTEVVMPLIKQSGTGKAIHVGDVFHDRTKIDVNTIDQAKQYFFEPLQQMGIEVDVITGNHDLYYRDSNAVNTMQHVANEYDNFNVHSAAYTKHIVDGCSLLYVPWMMNSNKDAILKEINASAADYVFGHLELIGYQIGRTRVATHGYDPKLFERFKHVFSGHFHHRHSARNITYLGSCQQHTWDDVGAVRGFHFFDTDSGELTFVPNPYNMFERIAVGQLTTTNFSGRYVRVTHDADTKRSEIDAYVKKIEAAGAADVQVIAAVETSRPTEDDQISIDVEDAFDLIRSMDDDPQVIDMMQQLYEKAKLLA